MYINTVLHHLFIVCDICTNIHSNLLVQQKVSLQYFSQKYSKRFKDVHIALTHSYKKLAKYWFTQPREEFILKYDYILIEFLTTMYTVSYLYILQERFIVTKWSLVTNYVLFLCVKYFSPCCKSSDKETR